MFFRHNIGYYRQATGANNMVIHVLSTKSSYSVLTVEFAFNWAEA